MKEYNIDDACQNLASAVFEGHQNFETIDWSLVDPEVILKEIKRKGKVFMSLLTDHGFKKGFCDDNIATPELTALVDGILEEIGQPLLGEAKFLNTELKGESHKERDAIFDARFIDANGRFISMEMQQSRLKFMLDRTSFYLSRAEVLGVKKGRAGNNFKGGPFMAISIINFVLFDEYPSVVEVVETIKGTNTQVADRRNRIFIQLPKFNKKIDQLEGDLDKFLYLLINMGNMHEVPEVFDNDLFRPVFEKMRIANLNIEQMRNYIATEQKGEIMRLRIEGAEEYGIEKGRKEGLEEGIEKGIKKGIEKGRKEEGERKSIEFICNLFSMGIRKKEKLARAVNVPLEFVERVLNDIDSGKIPSA
ncbi:hypothetical protein GCM10027566_28020 [Arachidicoccus ginsenosidivorans]|uniref:Rpn family recombination-promoting nuclease/putative transposase n=1 Tax=Arachidicoccus ginsenosidivorans TaxID=496057 RepID=A0A5B8VQY3_9BACT|nr:Rpn family recombination-promoting nuclease/putative transposase [Arachidicoccus ginsenosidivorans]QEC73673.1 Rpn family recombination-promoting nuclease/putative transposase [Arachidicoccus ginsenosidivorans]